MFVDGKSVKWEADGRRITADEMLGMAVHVIASSWGDRDFGEGGPDAFTPEELKRRIWNDNLPAPEEVGADGDIPTLLCSAIRRGLPHSVCYYCGANRDMAEAMHSDHMRPRFRGGSDRASNTVHACKNCNLRKSAHGVESFRARMAEEYGFDTLPRFFGELPKARRVLKIETQTAMARHPDFKPAKDHPLSRMGTAEG